jgi:hypothetical protein
MPIPSSGPVTGLCLVSGSDELLLAVDSVADQRSSAESQTFSMRLPEHSDHFQGSASFRRGWLTPSAVTYYLGDCHVVPVVEDEEILLQGRHCQLAAVLA